MRLQLALFLLLPGSAFVAEAPAGRDSAAMGQINEAYGRALRRFEQLELLNGLSGQQPAVRVQVMYRLKNDLAELESFLSEDHRGQVSDSESIRRDRALRETHKPTAGGGVRMGTPAMRNDLGDAYLQKQIKSALESTQRAIAAASVSDDSAMARHLASAEHAIKQLGAQGP